MPLFFTTMKHIIITKTCSFYIQGQIHQVNNKPQIENGDKYHRLITGIPGRDCWGNKITNYLINANHSEYLKHNKQLTLF